MHSDVFFSASQMWISAVYYTAVTNRDALLTRIICYWPWRDRSTLIHFLYFNVLLKLNHIQCFRYQLNAFSHAGLPRFQCVSMLFYPVWGSKRGLYSMVYRFLKLWEKGTVVFRRDKMTPWAEVTEFGSGEKGLYCRIPNCVSDSEQCEKPLLWAL